MRRPNICPKCLRRVEADGITPGDPIGAIETQNHKVEWKWCKVCQIQRWNEKPHAKF